MSTNFDNPFRPPESRAKKRLFAREKVVEIKTKIVRPEITDKLQETNKKRLSRQLDQFIKRIDGLSEPKFFVNVSEDPIVAEMLGQFEEFISKLSSQEIKEIALPKLDRSRKKSTFFSSVFVACRRQALTGLDGQESVNMIMANFAKSREKVKDYESDDELLESAAEIQLAMDDLKYLIDEGWPKKIDKLNEDPRKNAAEIEQLNKMSKYAQQKLKVLENIDQQL